MIPSRAGTETRPYAMDFADFIVGGRGDPPPGDGFRCSDLLLLKG
jgi:hypothetical protein